MKKQQDKNVEKKQKFHSSQMLLFGDVLILNINKWGSGGEGGGGRGPNKLWGVWKNWKVNKQGWHLFGTGE